MQQRIWDLREDLDMTQTQLAKRLHVSQQCYSNYEKGYTNIPFHILIALAKFHHTSVDYLLGLTQQREPYP